MAQQLQDSNLSLPQGEDLDNTDTGASIHADGKNDSKAPSQGSVADDAVDGFLSFGGHDASGASVSFDRQRDKSNIDHLQRKIEKIKQRLKEEQNIKEANVNEYLRVTANPEGYEKQQLQRIKSEFEKKNRSSAQIVSQLQKKLDNYKRNLKEAKEGSSITKPGRDFNFKQGLKDKGASIRDGISGFTGGVVGNIRDAKDSLVSKPKEIAHLIARKNNRFTIKSGSTGDIQNLKLDDELNDDSTEPEKLQPQQSSSLPRETKLTAEEEVCSEISGSGTSQNHSSPNPQSMTTSHHEQDLDVVLRDVQEFQSKMQDAFEAQKMQFHSECQSLQRQLEMEKYKNERLEELINEITEQHHDLTELHQHEITNIKQELSSMEEKMEYQLEERTRDMQEMLDTCQTRINKMEIQQQQQQLISVEGFENSNFRALITKLINVALALLAVVLVLVSTVVNMLSPFLTTRYRVFGTVLLAAAIFVTYHNWDFLKQYHLQVVAYLETLFIK